MKYSNPFNENDPQESFHDKYRRTQFPNMGDVDKWKTKPITPKPATISDLFPRLDRLSIGWSPILDQLREITNEKPAYPPYDLIQVNDEMNLLRVAVAGFAKDELTTTVQDSILTIAGKKTSEEEGKVLYKGIAGRDFELKLAIAEYWEITQAKLEDGMLNIEFIKKLPEEKKPKTIDIN